MWLIWWYLESDFSAHAAEHNPFGRGMHGDGTGGLPIKVPAFEHLTEEQANAENIDTEAEKMYGELKKLERKRILEVDESTGPPVKKGKKSKFEPPSLMVATCGYRGDLFYSCSSFSGIKKLTAARSNFRQ